VTNSDVYNVIYIPIVIFLIWVGFKKETVKWKITAELLAILALVAGMAIEISEERIDIPLILALVFALITLGIVVRRMVKIYSK